MSKRKPRDGYDERLSVGFTTEQMRRIEELLRVRARQGKMQHKTDLIREAVNLYLARGDHAQVGRAAGCGRSAANAPKRTAGPAGRFPLSAQAGRVGGGS
jgi:hypothetical protein